MTISDTSKINPAAVQFPKPQGGKYLRSIYFYILEGCNLRCRHCWINPPFEKTDKPEYPFVSLDLFKHIVNQAIPLGLQTVKLTGGEPLIHPEIEKIIEYIHEKNLKLNIETNGIAITPDLAKLILASKKPVSLSISIDSHIPETHDWVRNVKGSFDDAVRGVKYMIENGFHPQVIMSIMRRNAGDVTGLVALAESIGASSVKFNLVSPTARGEILHSKGEALSISELVELGNFVNNVLQKNTKIRLLYSSPPAFKSVDYLKKRPRIGNCGIFNTLGVLGTGKYALCGIGESLPEFIFGDANTDNLVDVWNDNPTLIRIRKGLPSELTGVCHDCIMKNGCLGSCIANNYNYYKDLFASHHFCEIAYAEGLFPLSRLVPGSKYAENHIKA